MSRVEVETEKLMAAFGADRATGTFVQIWEQPHDKQDFPVIHIDNMGVRLGEGVQEDYGGHVMALLQEIDARFDQSASHGNTRPNIDAATVGDLLVRLGFPRAVEREVFRAFD